MSILKGSTRHKNDMIKKRKTAVQREKKGVGKAKKERKRQNVTN
jgi:hypothetical protein